MKSEKPITGTSLYALGFGLFLGLAILKFGNPVILDHKITPPVSPAEFWTDAWPTHWGNWIFLPLALAGAALAFIGKPRWAGTRWLWVLPLLWFGWQLLSGTQTVDGNLTATTLWQFAGCVACCFLGTLVLGRERTVYWLLAGILAAFALCLIKGINQRLVEFPQSRQLLLEGERAGWTNIPPAMLVEMKHNRVVISTNGVDVANPAILAKFAKGRVNGTLVYPNTLAGLILLLLPVSLVLAFNRTKRLRPPIRATVIALTIGLGGMAFFWTGSKLGWLIALAIGSTCLFRLQWPMRLKLATLTVILLIGLVIFAVRFHSYFAAGATSVGARFDYWRAAVETTLEHPLFGTGRYFSTALRTAQVAGSRNGPPCPQRLPRTVFRFGHRGRNFLRGLDCSVAGNHRTTGMAVRRPDDVCSFCRTARLVRPRYRRVWPLVPALAWTAFTLLGVLQNEPGSNSSNGA